MLEILKLVGCGGIQEESVRAPSARAQHAVTDTRPGAEAAAAAATEPPLVTTKIKCLARNSPTSSGAPAAPRQFTPSFASSASEHLSVVHSMKKFTLYFWLQFKVLPDKFGWTSGSFAAGNLSSSISGSVTSLLLLVLTTSPAWVGGEFGAKFKKIKNNSPTVLMELKQKITPRTRKYD